MTAYRRMLDDVSYNLLINLNYLGNILSFLAMISARGGIPWW